MSIASFIKDFEEATSKMLFYPKDLAKSLIGKTNGSQKTFSIANNLIFKGAVSYSKIQSDVNKAKERYKNFENPSLTQKEYLNRVVTGVYSESISNALSKTYREEKAEWLITEAEDPNPDHMQNVGEVYIVGQGIAGEEPGDRYGCQCGFRILEDGETE